ncbi:DNA cytosine methyltransferase [Pedobacter paludis]|uniref:DNA (cytosine-5-)-methyltransferase n=1 Tax=Pedobacter paludis TaxID=2203212 RepID=A0A317F3N5_9SPHI|nr:DNA cytosine methyltransferase [Pedobacter paludis]PWS32657.1 DNA (cytosine-5-)-methyltransferase [Pedobacter paludis]
MLKHGSLFSGIGGFDIAASWVGWQNVFSCEKHPFCRQLLQYYWPNTVHYDDIFQFSATEYLGAIDIISGGFPCQPFSQSGRRKGTQDDRYLFPQTIRIIKEARPKWIVLENVSGLFSILEPGSLSKMEIQEIELFCEDYDQVPSRTIIRLQRRVIASIISEIRAAGYLLPELKDGTPVILCIPAAGIGAPHARNRVWFIAHADGFGDNLHQGDHQNCQGGDAAEVAQERKRKWRADFADGFSGLPYDNGIIETWSEEIGRVASFFPGQTAPGASQTGGFSIPSWENWPTQSAFCGGDDGISGGLDGITFSKWREESVRAFGNAIVPQVALDIFRTIDFLERGY